MSRRKRRRQVQESQSSSKAAELQATLALRAEENAAIKLRLIERELDHADSRNIYENWGLTVNGQTLIDRRDYAPIGNFGFGGRATYLGAPNGFHKTSLQDRHQGRDEPWIVTQDDLAAARGMARLVTTINCPAIGIIENLENYTLKRGCNYVAGEKKNSECPEGLVAAVQDVVDEFLDENSWHCNRDREALTRSHIDGETFLSMYPQKNGLTKVRFVEPDQVVEPSPVPFTDLELYQRWNVIVRNAANWIFGVHTPDHDVEYVYGYCLQWEPNGPYDYMPAEHMVHFKRNAFSTTKRGRSDFYPAWEWLLDQARLLRNTTAGAARLAAIAYIIQYATATKSEVESMRRTNADFSIDLRSSSGTAKTRNMEYEIPGDRLEVPEGQEYLAGPMGAERGQAFLEVCNGILRNVGTRFAMTEGMISGNDSNNNRASAVEAGSRFYNYIEGNQGRIGAFYEAVIWKALLFAFRAGRFARFGFAPSGQKGWSDFKRVVELAIEFPDIDPKQDMERTQKRQIMNGGRVMSVKTWRTQEKLDNEEEDANFEEEDKKMAAAQAAAQGGMGGGGNPFAAMMGGGAPPPGPEAVPPEPPGGAGPEAPDSGAPSASAPTPQPTSQPEWTGESVAHVQESHLDFNAGWWEFVACMNTQHRDKSKLKEVSESELSRLRLTWDSMPHANCARWARMAGSQARQMPAYVSEEWTSYQGKRGGKGWQWNGQGRPIYQEEKPRDRGDSAGDAPASKAPAATAPPAKPAAAPKAAAPSRQYLLRTVSGVEPAVEPQPVTVKGGDGLDLFVHKKGVGLYGISDARSGTSLGTGSTPEEAVAKVEATIKKAGLKRIQQSVAATVSQYGEIGAEQAVDASQPAAATPKPATAISADNWSVTKVGGVSPKDWSDDEKRQMYRWANMPLDQFMADVRKTQGNGFGTDDQSLQWAHSGHVLQAVQDGQAVNADNLRQYRDEIVSQRDDLQDAIDKQLATSFNASPAPQSTVAPGNATRGSAAIQAEVSKWTPEQRKADWKAHKTKGASFKAWFGDWEHDQQNASKVRDSETGEPAETNPIEGAASKAVGADGKPKIVYHGTAKGGFDAFSKDKAGGKDNLYGNGFYFTEDKGIAEEYQEKGMSKRLLRGDESQTGAIVRQRLTSLDSAAQQQSQAKQLLKYSDTQLGEFVSDTGAEGTALQQTGIDTSDLYGDPEATPETKAVYLNIRNPLDMDGDLPKDVLEKLQALNTDGKYDVRALSPKASNVYYALANQGMDKERANRILRQAGYDGITHMGGGRWTVGSKEHRVWIAFEPTQIKAKNNQGTFDAENPKLRESVRLLHAGQVLFEGELPTALQILEAGYQQYGDEAVEGVVVESDAGRATAESFLIESSEPDDGGRWVTLKNGRRVYLDSEGTITKGLGTGQHVTHFGKHGPAQVNLEPERTHDFRGGKDPKEPSEITAKLKDAAKHFEQWLQSWFKAGSSDAKRLLGRRAARSIRANVALTSLGQAKRSVVKDMVSDFKEWVKSQYREGKSIEDTDRLLQTRITSIAGESEAQRWRERAVMESAAQSPSPVDVQAAVLQGTLQAIEQHYRP